MGIKELAERESKRLDEERQKRMDEMDLAPFLSIKDGDSLILKFADQEPRDRNGKFGFRKVFRVTAKIRNPEGAEVESEFDYEVNPRSPFYADLMDALKASTNLQITRVGSGQKDTKYSVKVI